MERNFVCPICGGRGLLNREEGLVNCYNCGVKGMSDKVPDGKVSPRPDGTACVHDFKKDTIFRGYHRYTCTHCNYQYHIDSGD